MSSIFTNSNFSVANSTSKRQKISSDFYTTSSNSTSLDRSAKYSFNLETPHLSWDHDGKKITKKSSGICSLQTPFQESSSNGSKHTPKTPASRTPLGNNAQTSNVVAIVEGRGMAKGEIGMACIDLKGAELIISQFSDGPTYVKILCKLQIIQPVEIIMPNTSYENGKMTQLFQVISEQFPYVTLTTVQRKYFNESKGLQYIRQLCVPEFNTVEMDVQSKYYCLATAAALLKYVEFIQNVVFAPASLKITYKGGEKTALIDMTAARHLELVHNLRNPKSKQSLYGVLNYTKTAGGARLLRSNILQPPCDLQTIQTRFDCIEELVEKEELFLNLQAIIGKFLDVDHLISSTVQIPKKEGIKVFERKIAEIIFLKHTIELVQILQNALADGQNSLFKAYYQSLDDSRFVNLLEQIKTVIHDESRYQKGALNMRTQKLFAVKPNVNGLLDVARRTHCEVVDDITEMIHQEATSTGLMLTPSYNNTRGFHITLNTNGNNNLVDALPSHFIKIVRAKSVISCTTEDLIKLNTRLDESLEEIYFLSNMVVGELMKNIRDQIGCLYKLAECISTLDLLVSLAHACTLSNYIRPEFTDTLALKQSRHPVLDRMSSLPIIPNDVYASDVSNFILITGPNMSGKSTYLRQIALLQIMAQCGSFVPAEYASFRLTNQIFVRIGSDDDIETNCSTFKLEMKEMNYILQNIRDDSLLIVDELGRGTSVEEGIGITFSICEYLLSKKAFTYFATHFHSLCDLENLYPNVENYNFEVQQVVDQTQSTENMQFTHVLVKGRTTVENYGLKLAEMSTLPVELVEKAKEIALQLQQRKNENQKSLESSKREKAVFRLVTRLLQAAKNSRLDEETLRLYLAGLKRQFIADISEE
ncbi:mutS protein homolog 4 isoform X6 [Hydra vulgaris]|uniref:MutS protein homolog 4 isoform X6 n=1 Tax=Hydra vulgaris TaxID=6087 RepID=A0ABM4BCL1_HYDVU